jgi:Fis family transcriptional regulator, factor for inversion stimulation protein
MEVTASRREREHLRSPRTVTTSNRFAAPTYRGAERPVKQQLESLVSEMIEKGILFTEAKREFEKKFISRVLQRHRGNLSRAAKDLKIHRNTLGKKIEEYKL